MSNIGDYIKKFFDELPGNLEKDPRYLINQMADNNGEIRIYFASSHEYNEYIAGRESKGSTERFLPSDTFYNVPKERIEKITDGMTIAHLAAAQS